MRLTRLGLLLLAPAALVYTLLLTLPILTVLDESLREYIPGRIGSTPDTPLTFQNYLEFADHAYLGFLWTTFKLAGIVALIATAIAFPIAHFIARQRSSAIRRAFIGLLITMMFLSALVRVYSIQLAFGSVGILAPVLKQLGFNLNSRTYVEWTVVAGLLHFVIPMASLTLIGTIQNINPRVFEAAQALGASRLRAHMSITIPLAAPGLLSSFLITLTIGISAFVVPWVLGKGRVIFVSNVVYSRFSEVANYPSGSAASVLMLMLSLVIVFAALRVAARAQGGAGN